MSTRTVITDLDTLDKVLPNLYDIHYAFDIETSGLSAINDELLGIALTLEDQRSYYIVLKHTVPHVETVTRKDVVKIVTGSEEYEHITPSGKTKIKQRPVFEEQEQDVTEDVTTYPMVTFMEEREVINRLRPLFMQPNVEMVAHNAQFDLMFLVRRGLIVSGKLVDTMLAAQMTNENRPSNSLKKLAALVDVEMVAYKELVSYPGFAKEAILGVPLEQAANYAMLDTETTWRLWETFRLELDEEGVSKAFTDLWMPLVPVLVDMQLRGVAMDMPAIKEARKTYEVMRDENERVIWRAGMQMLLARMERHGINDALQFEGHIGAGYLKSAHEIVSEAVDDDQERVIVNDLDLPLLRKTNKTYRARIPWFNPASNLHLKDLLYNHFGLTIPKDIKLKKNATGEDGVDKNTLVVIKHAMGENVHSILDNVLQMRKATKMLSTYFDAYEKRTDPNDHYCIRTNFNQAVTDTGRLSSSSPNLQNQPSRGEEGKLIRSLFVARPGYKLICADFSGMELRLLAHYSQDPTMMSAFVDGLDLHALTASTQTSIPYDEFMRRLADDDMDVKMARFIGKTSNFGLAYGMRAAAFRTYLLVNNGVLVTFDRSQELIDGFDTTYAQMTEWKGEVVKWARRLGYAKSITGRKRRLPDINARGWQAGAAERQAVNYVIQGSCADILISVMPPIQQMLASLGGSLLLSVHDELVCEVPESVADTSAKLLSTMMCDLPNEKFQLRCPLIAEAHVADNWGAAKG